jgi:DNA primase
MSRPRATARATPPPARDPYRLARLKERHRLADHVQGHSAGPIRTRGPRLLCLCPLHEERTPSFMIYPARGPGEADSFHCFGCRAGGDIFDYLGAYHGWDFAQTLAYLEGDEGRAATPFRPPRYDPAAFERDDADATAWEALTPPQLDFVELLTGTYEAILWSIEATPVRAYLIERRGLTPATIRRSRLGLSLGGDTLIARLGAPALATGLALGLLREGSQGGTREHLAGRLICPELRGGRPIWLQGRALDPGYLPEGAACTRAVRAAARPDARKYLFPPGPRPLIGHEDALAPVSVACEGVFDRYVARQWGYRAWAVGGTGFPARRLAFLPPDARIYRVGDADRGGAVFAAHLDGILGDRAVPVDLPAGHDLGDLGALPDGRARFAALLAEADARDRAERAMAVALTHLRDPEGVHRLARLVDDLPGGPSDRLARAIYAATPPPDDD